MNMSENDKIEIKGYSLRDISKWQDELNDQNKSVELPSLQRGFVWKTEQIEALWDSIFRGYPIGAILMSIDEKDDTRLLLDGQQRSTSIALGFFNPFDENRKIDYLSLKNYLPSIWIDIQPKEITQSQKFLFRVLTKSHPWGYQNKDNTKTLSMSERKNAFKYFQTKQQTKNYIDFSPSNISPWDAYYPVPLSFILDFENVKTVEEFQDQLKLKLRDLKIQTKHSHSVNINYEEISDENYKLIFDGLQHAKSLKIPEIAVKAGILKDEDDTLDNEIKDPTLFVRLNSKGTQISGEELIYSIYKAVFPKSKELVEEIGASFIAPSKVINIFSRLANCQINEFRNYVVPYNINTFRKAIKDISYKTELKHLIDDKIAIELIETAKKIIKQNNEDFPNIILKELIVSDIDLFFTLIVYIQKNNLNEGVSETEIKEISANYVHLLWFCKEKKYHSKLFGLIITYNLSWKEATQKLIEQELIIPIVNAELLKKNLLKIVETNLNYDRIGFENLDNEIKSSLTIKENFSEEQILENWYNHIGYIRNNKTLLLYAQRYYLNDKFKEFNQIESIEDTNRPWDYDHIYPISWVYNKVSINYLIRNWVNTIGNYRALSYDDNRSESNHKSPKERFKEDQNKSDSFVKENDFEFWDKLDNRSWRITHNDNEMIKNFMTAVIHRMCNIYGEWYVNYYQK